MKIYKYLPGDEGSFKALINSTIKFSDPRSFNDPFDCVPYIEIPTVQSILKDKPEMLDKFFKSRGVKGANKFTVRKKAIASLKKAVKDGVFLEPIHEKARILSLSTTPYEILMWSHYANNHKGFILQFDVPLETVAKNIVNFPEERMFRAKVWNLYFDKVLYKENRPVMRAYQNESAPECYLNLLLTKSKAWEYEEEVRVIDNRGGSGINRYNPDLLCSVICGVNTEPDVVQKLKKLTHDFNISNHTSVRLLQAITCKKTYRILIPGLEE